MSRRQFAQIGQESFLVGKLVDLVDDRNDRSLGIGQGAQGLLVFPGEAPGLHEQQGQIDIAHNGPCRAIEVAVEGTLPALVDARRIDEDDLAAGRGLDSQDGVARSLGLVGGDGQLHAEDAVQQGRFADVGPADDGDLTTAIGSVGLGGLGIGCIRCHELSVSA